MKFSLKNAVIVFTFFLAGCSSMHNELRTVKVGTFKRQALSKFGEPHEKYRTQGLDHWIYETQKRSKKGNEPLVYQHTLIFNEGIMVNKRFRRTFTSRELETYYNKKN